MFWWIAAAFFLFCALREIWRGSKHRGPEALTLARTWWTFVFICLALSAGLAWVPGRYWLLERELERVSTTLADGRKAKVHCNTFFDTMFDPNQLAAGHANIETGEVVMQKPWCGRILDYLADPYHADREQIFALHMITHEAMHVRGERDERKTECQAIQRNYRTAVLLGIPDHLAARHALEYYQTMYMQRAEVGGLSGSYFSPQCKPRGALDERLPDSTWAQMHKLESGGRARRRFQ
jgi:hypothetical protein